MNANVKTPAMLVMFAAATLLSVGCSERTPSATVGEKVDRAADKVADATQRAGTEVAAVVDDAAVTAKIKAALVAEPGLSALKIDVDTKAAVVTLTGTVDNPTMKERALQIAGGAAGVRSVVDNLTIKQG